MHGIVKRLTLRGAAVVDAALSPEERFVRSQTAVDRPALCPEITLHLASEITPIWEATEKQLGEQAMPPPFWAFCWPGGQALSRHVLDHPDLVRGRRVMDFAAGGGATAIAAALSRARHVVAVEIDPFAATAIALNAGLNDCDIEVWMEDLVGRGPAGVTAGDGGFDVVLAGDICYEKPMTDRVLPLLQGLADQGATVLLGDPGRAYLPRQGLIERARYEVPTSFALEDRDRRTVTIWELPARSHGQMALDV